MARHERTPNGQLEAHIDRAWDRAHAGDVDTALRAAQKAAELDAESPDVQHLLGYIHSIRGDAKRAVDHYRQAIQLDESFVEAMLNAAEVLLHPLQDFEAAIGLVDDAIEWIEDDLELADALLLKAEAEFGKGLRSAAEATLRRIPKKAMEEGVIAANVGRALFDLGKHDEAEALLKRAVATEPNHSDAHYTLGLCAEQRGDLVGMATAFLRARDADVRQLPKWTSEELESFEGEVRKALGLLPPNAKQVVDGAFVVVVDLPGAEVVADGVDPRALVLLDGLSPPEDAPKAQRLFVYRANVVRLGADTVAEVRAAIEREVDLTFFATDLN